MGTGDFPVLFLQLQACNYLKTESYKVIPFPPGVGVGSIAEESYEQGAVPKGKKPQKSEYRNSQNIQ